MPIDPRGRRHGSPRALRSHQLMFSQQFDGPISAISGRRWKVVALRDPMQFTSQASGRATVIWAIFSSGSGSIAADGLVLRGDLVGHVRDQFSLGVSSAHATEPKGGGATGFDDLTRDPFQLFLGPCIPREGNQAIG